MAVRQGAATDRQPAPEPPSTDVVADRSDPGEGDVGAFRWIDHLWRVGLAVTIISGSIKGTALAPAWTEVQLQLAQFAPLGVCLGLMIAFPRGRVPLSGPVRVFVFALIALAAWALASTAWSTDPETPAQAALFCFVTVFIVVTLTLRWLSSQIVLADLLSIYLVILGIQVVGLYRGFTGQGDAVDSLGRLQGILVNPNYTGFMAALALCLVMPLAAWLKSGLPRLAMIMSALVPFVALLWSGSRGALVGVVVLPIASLLMSARWRLWRVPALYAATLLTVVLYGQGTLGALANAQQFQRVGSSDYASGRFTIWRAILERWGEHLFLGTGYDSTQRLNVDTGLNAHNLLLSVGVELGIVGASLLVVLFASIVAGRDRHGLLAPLSGAVACILVFEMTEASLLGFGNPTAMIAWLLLGAVVSGHRRREAHVSASVEDTGAR